MTVYSYAQLESLWINAGGSKSLAPLAAAIAEAESGGNSDAYNPKDSNGRGGTQVSAGLWQISNGTMTPPANWANPAVNAQDAVAKWKSAHGFSPWGTYTSGAYKTFMSSKTTPDPNVPGSPTQLDAQAAATATADCAVPFPSWHAGVFFGHGPTVGGGCLLSNSAARAIVAVANMAVGASGLMIGLAFMAVFSGPGKMVLNLVTSVVPQTRAVKGATAGASTRATHESGYGTIPAGDAAKAARADAAKSAA